MSKMSQRELTPMARRDEDTLTVDGITCKKL